MKAVIETGGKQYYVEKGSVIYVEKLDNEVDSVVKFDRVLMLGETVGSPLVSSALVEGKVVKHGRNKKIRVFKYNPKKKYRKTQGHRQSYTKIEITNVK